MSEALDQVQQIPLSCLSAVELAERARKLRRLATRLEAVECATLTAAAAATDGPGVFKQLGFRHAIGYIADETNCDPKVLRRRDRLGRWLIDFPVFAEAFHAGTLSIRHVERLKSLDKPKTHLPLIEAQEYFVARVPELSWGDFGKMCRYWANAADPDGDEPRDQATKTGCRMKRNPDGTVSGSFTFDPLTGHAVKTALDNETERLFRQDAEEGMKRSEGARRGVALLNLLVRGFNKGGNSKITPLIHVVMGAALAENLVARLAGEDVEPLEPSFDDVDRRCELADGTPIHPNQAALALAAGWFTRTVMGEKSRITDVADKARSFPRWMKQLLMVRARGRCQWAGCDAPFAWLQADHVEPHSRGGPTSLANGQILCDPHNKWKRDDLAA